MASDLRLDMIHVLARGLVMLLHETPENNTHIVLLQQCKQSLEWLQAQVQEIDNRPEITEMLSNSIITVSHMIDRSNEQSRAKLTTRRYEPDQVEPFNLVNLFAAWDRDFPGGSAAVLEQIKEIVSRVDARKLNQHISTEK